MPQCAVATCRNSHRRTRGRRIRYHRFPQIPEVRMRWVRACGRVPLSNGEVPFNIQTARICSLHFNNESYEKDIEHLVLDLPARSRLRRGAVPTLGVPVNVQPVTNMLVEDAKRSLLKVTQHASIIKDRRITGAVTSQQRKAKEDEKDAAADDDDDDDDDNNEQRRHFTTGKNKTRNSNAANVVCPAGKRATAGGDNENNATNDEETKYIYGGRANDEDLLTEQQRRNYCYRNNKRAAACNEAAHPRATTIDGTADQRKMADIDVLLALGLKPAPRLNKMHAAAEYGGSGGGGTTVKKLDQSDEKRDEDSRGSPKVPQSRQNGAALPEETAIAAIATTMANAAVNSERLRPTVVKSENHSDTENEGEEETTADVPSPKERSRSRRASIPDETTPTSDSRNPRKKSPTNNGSSRLVVKSERGENNPRKRHSNDDAIGCGQQFAKKIRFEQRERYIDSLVGTTERISAEELATRADELRAEVQALDELARAKEMEWNEILSMRKLKEEAYLRIERRRQIVGYMESNGPSASSENLPPASLSLTADWESTAENMTTATTTTTTTAMTTRTRSQDTATSSRDNIKDSGAATASDVSVRLIETTRESQKSDETCRERSSPAPSTKREQKVASLGTSVKGSSNNAQRRTASPKQLPENGRKQQQQRNQQQQQQQRQQQQLSEQSALDNRQIGEGRQGPIVDVRSIIADYRLRHPESVPRRYDSKRESPARGRETTGNTRTSGLINVRRGRRMRNSVNVGLGAGGAMVETSGGSGGGHHQHHHHHHHHHDSRPSSTDSCKSSNERITTGAAAAASTSSDPNNSMSFKDVLVQFAKLSQQQGEPVKTPQNYPDVTLHPVAPTTVTINSAPTNQQTTGSLLHGILTKSQSPRPTTFSPTLARLLTAPERERTNLPTSITAIPQQNIQTQHLLQTYQGSNPVSISDLLSSSKARTEITITPVVTPITPGHVSQSNSLVHVDDVEEETSLIDERDSRLGSGPRDSRDERDSPPRCQGCQERAAQFVCAGCGNQWYCSRDCQVAAWDDHSEVCSG